MKIQKKKEKNNNNNNNNSITRIFKFKINKLYIYKRKEVI